MYNFYERDNTILDNISNYLRKSKLKSKSTKSWILKIVGITLAVGLSIFAICKYLEPEYEENNVEEETEN